MPPRKAKKPKGWEDHMGYWSMMVSQVFMDRYWETERLCPGCEEKKPTVEFLTFKNGNRITPHINVVCRLCTEAGRTYFKLPTEKKHCLKCKFCKTKIVYGTDFCSTEHRFLYDQQNGIVAPYKWRACTYCGKHYMRRDGSPSYCSPECMCNHAEKTGRDMGDKCFWCGGPLTDRREGRLFCCKACAGKYNTRRAQEMFLNNETSPERMKCSKCGNYRALSAYIDEESGARYLVCVYCREEKPAKLGRRKPPEADLYDDAELDAPLYEAKRHYCKKCGAATANHFYCNTCLGEDALQDHL